MPEIIYDAKKKGPGSWSFDALDKLKNSGRFGSQWGSLMVKPENIKFDSLDDDEIVILLGRRHIVTNLGWISIISVLFFIPFFWGGFPFFSSLNDNVHLSVVILWYLGISFFALTNLLNWFYNVYIVTNERLIDVEFLGLLSKSLDVTQISRIEDVSYSQKGLMASFFNYGEVIVETASEQRTSDVAEGELSSFMFESIGYPNDVVRIISDLMEMEDDEKVVNKLK